MKRSALWGLVLLLVGGLLLLDNLGYLDFLGVSAWQIMMPLGLIGLGVWFLVGRSAGTGSEARELNIGLKTAQEADVRIDYGAGELTVTAGEDPGSLLAGSFEGGVEERVEYRDDQAQVWLHSQSLTVVWPWFWGPGVRRRWDVRLARHVPLQLTVKTGASDCRLDLSDLQVRSLNIDSGASSLQVTLPAHAGYTEVRGSSGAASLTLRVPDGVAARIWTRGGLSTTDVDHRRFLRRGGHFESPDYETAQNRVDIRLQIGVGSIAIH